MNKRDWKNHPPMIFPPYKSTVLRGPVIPLVTLPEELTDIRMPVYGDSVIDALDNDLTQNARKDGEPIGERMVVHGKVLDEDGHGISKVLLEIWQCNSAGRYIHKMDRHNAPIDPNFSGAGRTLTDKDGNYHFYSIRPGAYPWGNHDNAWRPGHIHFSVFGHHFSNRLITQMYFPGDPLFEYDPIFNSVPKHARHLLVSDFKMELTEPKFALGYEFNIVLRGKNKTPLEP